jgi:hypothetical protein
MKTNLTLFFTILIMCIVSNIEAQNKNLSSTEKKEIKKKLKDFKKHPETYKSMVTNYDNSIKDRDTKMEEMELEIIRWKTKYRLDMKECNDSLFVLRERLKNDTNSIQNSTSNSVVSSTNGCGQKLPAGTVYGVQMGSYKFFDLTKYYGADKYMIAFFDNEAHQYVISYFSNFEDADACKKDIRKLGIKDAFVTQYTDGKRVPLVYKRPQ